MFRRQQGGIVSQREHSRFSGELASLIGLAVGVDQSRLFAAIAWHDWPHFSQGVEGDTVEIGQKTNQQQHALLDRLAGDQPFDAFTELIMRWHWRRLNVQMGRPADDQNIQRVESLCRDLGLDEQQMARYDRWTDFCDALAFYVSRGEAAEGDFALPDPVQDRQWGLHWRTSGDAVVVEHVPHPFRGQLSLMIYDAAGYPDRLQPDFVRVSCQFAA